VFDLLEVKILLLKSLFNLFNYNTANANDVL